jgi:hypothetical protein
MWCALILVALLAVGCSNGPRRAAVSGTVRVDGKPLERGVINFLPVDGNRGPGAGGVIKDGAFDVKAADGPVVGNNRVEIRGFRKTGRKITVQRETIDEEIQVVPAEFNDQSKLVREIHERENTLEFDLPGKK